MFCKSLRELGRKIYVDTDCPVGHISTATVWPQRYGEHWATALMGGESQLALFPAVSYAPPKP